MLPPLSFIPLSIPVLFAQISLLDVFLTKRAPFLLTYGGILPSSLRILRLSPSYSLLVHLCQFEYSCLSHLSMTSRFWIPCLHPWTTLKKYPEVWPSLFSCRLSTGLLRREPPHMSHHFLMMRPSTCWTFGCFDLNHMRSPKRAWRLGCSSSVLISSLARPYVGYWFPLMFSFRLHLRGCMFTQRLL